MTWLAGALVAAGALLLLVAGWGVLRLPHALARQHAATLAGTLALACVLLGVLLAVRQGAWSWRLALLDVVLLVTLPLSSQVLARAAATQARWDRLAEPADADAA